MLIDRMLPYAILALVLVMTALGWLAGAKNEHNKLIQAYVAGWQCGTQWHDAKDCHSEARRIFDQ